MMSEELVANLLKIEKVFDAFYYVPLPFLVVLNDPLTPPTVLHRLVYF